MKHSWLEREDGTAKCRRCPAVREQVRKVVGRRKVLRGIDDYSGDPIVDVETERATAVEVHGAHPSKCRPGNG